ncbi:MAG: fasciclin domain-containing protein [Woeseiaceae bacterium]|nr:fasciclin domain-containing protein [Woeseiaceae bacterium]
MATLKNTISLSLVALFALATSAATAGMYGDKASKNIVETAVSAGQFTTLAAALDAAGLVETLEGEGPFTVFAPTDAAFAKLPEGTIENLLKPENRDQLVAVLTYHVVPGKVKAAQVVELDKAKTVNGAEVRITVADNGVRVDDANVVKTDIDASNGVIHVIDTVILPGS